MVSTWNSGPVSISSIARRCFVFARIQTRPLWIPKPERHLLWNENSAIPTVSVYLDWCTDTKLSCAWQIVVFCLSSQTALIVSAAFIAAGHNGVGHDRSVGLTVGIEVREKVYLRL